MLNPCPLSLLIPREEWPGIVCIIFVQDVVAEYSKILIRIGILEIFETIYQIIRWFEMKGLL